MDDVRPLLIEAIFEEAKPCLTLTRQVKDSRAFAIVALGRGGGVRDGRTPASLPIAVKVPPSTTPKGWSHAKTGAALMMEEKVHIWGDSCKTRNSKDKKPGDGQSGGNHQNRRRAYKSKFIRIPLLL